MKYSFASNQNCFQAEYELRKNLPPQFPKKRNDVYITRSVFFMMPLIISIALGVTSGSLCEEILRLFNEGNASGLEDNR